ncbi:hypothetical protein VKT23_009856 [Stygiomarasmius scandens]|uniref:Uncharacterized protein n=1 Tax=Marasmiellus scandens TaxID=2682957 RepID=A0ABR1JED0_9AGAR
MTQRCGYLEKSKAIVEDLQIRILESPRHKKHLEELAVDSETLISHAKKQHERYTERFLFEDEAFTANYRSLPSFLEEVKGFIIVHNARNRISGNLLYKLDLMKIQKYKKKFHNKLRSLTIESTRIGMEIISNCREVLPSAAPKSTPLSSVNGHTAKPSFPSPSTLSASTQSQLAISPGAADSNPESSTRPAPSPVTQELEITLASSMRNSNVSRSTFNSVGRDQFNVLQNGPVQGNVYYIINGNHTQDH